jgi:hypothetical protein
MDCIRFTYNGLTFEIHTLDVMVCIDSGDTVGLITPTLTLSQIRSMCEKYIEFLKNEQNEG